MTIEELLNENVSQTATVPCGKTDNTSPNLSQEICVDKNSGFVKGVYNLSRKVVAQPISENPEHDDLKSKIKY